MEKFSKKILLKVTPDLNEAIDRALSKKIIGGGKHITKSELMRKAIETAVLTSQAREYHTTELYENSVSLINKFIYFLLEVKQYFLRMNKGATAKDVPHEIMMKYFLSVISRVNDARLLGGNVYSFQTLHSIERALFESAVDLTILNRENDPKIFDKMKAWDRWTLIRHARSVSEYVKEFNIDVNSGAGKEFQFLVEHVSDTKKIDAEVANIKSVIGCKGYKTWTGKRALEFNVDYADNLSSYDFYKHYKTRYKIISSDTHGNGVAGLGTTEPELFMGRCLFTYNLIIRWATISYYEAFSFFKMIDDVHLVKLFHMFLGHFYYLNDDLRKLYLRGE